MPAIRISADKNRTFRVFRDETLIVSNVDYDLVFVCVQELARLDAAAGLEPERSSLVVEHAEAAAGSERRRGRPLVLAAYLDLVRHILAQDPSATAKTVDERLRALGVKASSVGAVRNLARRYDLDLSAASATPSGPVPHAAFSDRSDKGRSEESASGTGS